MEQTKTHKKLIHGICFHKIFLSNPDKVRDQDKAALLKYFPKHIASLHFKLSNGNLNTRTKRLKLIKKLTCEKNPHPTFWRLVVANKQKSVQSFKKQEYYWDQNYTKLHVNVQFTKMFPNMRNVHLSPPDSKNLGQKGLYWMYRISCYLNNLNNLQYLKVVLPDQAPFQILSKLENSQRILSHLKVFGIDLSLLDSQNLGTLPKFLTYKGVLKHLTILWLDTLSGKDFFETFQFLSESCPRLSFLCCNTSQKFSQGETAYLQSLKNFNNLEELYLSTSHGLELLKNCIFPKSLRLLHLSFSEVDWEELVDNPSSIVVFDHQPGNLMNLETVNIAFPDVPKDQQQFSHNHRLAIEIFVQDLLKKIPTCKELNLTLSCEYSYDHIFKASPFLFDLSCFLKSIEHLSQSLEVLNISDKYKDYHLAGIKIQPVAFPKLSSLSISTEMTPFIEFDDIINIVQVQGPNSSVKLEGIHVESTETLLNFLRKLGQMNNIAADKRVEMVVYAENLDANELYFARNFEDVKREIGIVKNLFLLIKLRKSGFRFLRELESFQPLFGEFKVEKLNY